MMDGTQKAKNILAAINSIRRQLDTIEEQLHKLEGMPPKALSLHEWLNLKEYPISTSLRRKLEWADEQLKAGHSYEEIVRIYRWQRKTSLLPVLERFCKERAEAEKPKGE